MLDQISILRKKINRRSFFGDFANRFYLILFTISLFGQYAYAVSLSAGTVHESIKGKIQFNAPEAHHDVANPFDFPLISEPDSEDSESDTDPDEKFGSEFLFATSFGIESQGHSADKCATSSFVSLLLKREFVSLFVLHHSWKSDLV